ncbi:hypothetical protein ACQ4PT_071732 [Festuca glaucescens]
MASSPSGIDLDGDLSLHKEMASKMDLRGAKDPEGNTALHWAASRGCLESCQFQVEECGIDVNAVSKIGHCEVVRLLLSEGVPVDPVDHRGPPLQLAVSKDHDEVVKVLLEHSADAEVSMEERIAQWKSRGKEAFAKEDYFNAMYYYNLTSCDLRKQAINSAVQSEYYRQIYVLEENLELIRRQVGFEHVEVVTVSTV